MRSLWSTTGQRAVSAARYTERDMTAHELNEQFGLPGVLAFDEHGSLVRAQATLASCEATIYLQGAHLAHWKPAGQDPVLFMSERSAFEPGKAIRGGIPICFPWFGPPGEGAPGPSHGFARIQPWELAFAAVMPDSGEGDRLQLTFVLAPTEMSRSLGFDKFRVAYEVLLGATLSLRLTVANLGDAPLQFEEALHSYFSVGDVRQAPITGLESAPYLDKRDGGRAKTAPTGPLQLDCFTDRVFPASHASTAIHDVLRHRRIEIVKAESATTVVWNPWPEGSAPLADLAPDSWPGFLCVESANTASDAISLAPGATHTLALRVSVRQEN